MRVSQRKDKANQMAHPKKGIQYSFSRHNASLFTPKAGDEIKGNKCVEQKKKDEFHKMSPKMIEYRFNLHNASLFTSKLETKMKEKKCVNEKMKCEVNSMPRRRIEVQIQSP